jgi:protein-arginine kinase activator protein McsA
MISFLYELSDTTNSYHHVVVVYDVLEGIKEMIKSDEALPENSNKDISQYFTCRSCGMKFDSFGDMQRHILVEHMQKGDIISDEKSEK